MKQIFIACAMMEDEIQKVYKEIDCHIPIVWLDRGYHNTPDKLREKLQNLINEYQDVDEILLGFGLCGKGTEGLVSPKATVIMPKFDDCINMFLCNGKRHARALAKAGHFYLTQGWTKDTETILSQYEKYIEDYDEETAEALIEMMYGQYEKISVIDTGSYDLDPILDYAKKAGELLDLSLETVDGSTELLKQLLTRKWDENFIVLKPGTSVEMSLFDM